jgi:hypothetical protein
MCRCWRDRNIPPVRGVDKAEFLKYKYEKRYLIVNCGEGWLGTIPCQTRINQRPAAKINFRCFDNGF